MRHRFVDLIVAYAGPNFNLLYSERRVEKDVAELMQDVGVGRVCMRLELNLAI